MEKPRAQKEYHERKKDRKEKHFAKRKEKESRNIMLKRLSYNIREKRMEKANMRNRQSFERFD